MLNSLIGDTNTAFVIGAVIGLVTGWIIGDVIRSHKKDKH